MTGSGYVDLHTHSTASDGSFSPKQAARKAKENGLCAIALTDHDTTGGIGEFLSECSLIGIEGIAGVEISAKYSKTMHIVGLFIDPYDRELNAKLEELRDGRKKRNTDMLSALKKGGFDVTERDIISQKPDASLSNTGRSHMARAMLEKGYVKSVDEAFDKYLAKGRPFYVANALISPKESIELIKNAGGTAILAHPNLISDDYSELFLLLSELREYGLDGMECYYNNYTDEFSNICKRICAELSLAESGGSDFHGITKPNVRLGVTTAGAIPYSVLRKIKERRGREYYKWRER